MNPKDIIMSARLTLIALCCFISQAAFAQSIGDTATKFGLIGHWAQNCSAEAVPGNWHLDYFINSSGKVIRRMFRAGEERFSTIEKTEKIDSGTLSVHEVYGKGWGEHVGVTKDYKLSFTDDHSKYQSIVSEYDDGKSFIKDGKMTATGKKSPVVEKCSK